MLVLSTGFMFGVVKDPSTTAGSRFSHPLPPDNDIPFLFVEALEKGHVPKPLLGEWHSSDRPPLQTSIVFSQFAYLQHPRKLQYTVISVILQSLWIFALWLFLAAFELDSRCIALALTVCLLSGFVFLNSFYVWPKLLAASYMLGFSAILLAGRFANALQQTVFVPLLAAALATFGLLAHGASVFAIVGIGFTILLLRRRVALRSIVIIGVTVFCFYLPWILYQKLYDPPGDRLLKWHLAGVIAVDSRSVIQALTRAYRELTFHQFLSNKLANLWAVIDHQTEYWVSIGQFVRQLAKSDPSNTVEIGKTAGALRAVCFFFFAPSLGFLIVGPISLLVGIRRRCRSREWKTAAISWMYVILIATIWCTLIFIPGGTVIHTSTYVMVLLAFVGSILAFWAASPWIAVLLGSLQVEMNFLLYISFMNFKAPLRFVTAGLAILSLVCTLFLLKSVARWRDPVEHKKARQARA